MVRLGTGIFMQNGLFNIFVSRLARFALLNVDGNVEKYVGKYFATVGGIWAGLFQEQISCQIVDVTKPWWATPGYEHRFKGSFP